MSFREKHAIVFPYITVIRSLKMISKINLIYTQILYFSFPLLRIDMLSYARGSIRRRDKRALVEADFTSDILVLVNLPSRPVNWQRCREQRILTKWILSNPANVRHLLIEHFRSWDQKIIDEREILIFGFYYVSSIHLLSTISKCSRYYKLLCIAVCKHDLNLIGCYFFKCSKKINRKMWCKIYNY